MSRSTRWLAALLFLCLSALLLTGLVEWEHYRRLLRWHKVPLAVWDRGLLFWILWSKSLLPLLPFVALAGAFLWRGYERTSTWLLAAAWMTTFFWLGLDLAVQKRFGSHAFDYLPFLQDAAASGLETNTFEWAGDISGMLWGGVALFAAVAAAGAGSAWCCRRVAARIEKRYPRFTTPRAVVFASGLLAAAVWGILPLEGFFADPFMLRHFHAALPVDTEWSTAYFSPIRAGWRIAFGDGDDAGADEGLRIVSVLPNPYAERPGEEFIDLHNFGHGDAILDGLHLRNKRGQRWHLSGRVPPAETLRLMLPEDQILLDDRGDEVMLVDASGQVHEGVKFTSDDAQDGAVLSFRDEQDANQFLAQVNRGAQGVYRDLYTELTTPRPVDERATVTGERLPNVVLIVLESLRASALSPELMSRLDKWSQGGLRCRRHYAGSNASHFGIFSLLYGRSPLSYDCTLDARVPPQLVDSLARSGYGATFYTSGNHIGFRRMHEFINERHFDGVIVESGESWRDWPDRDALVLSHVRRTLTQTDRPQFVMAFLMSTHYPYSFPQSFERYTPCGNKVNKETWATMSPEVLHNRYCNAALYLEDELMRLIESLDPKRNIVILTGDHGESLSEDGALAHGNRASEVQTRVPFAIVGPGFSPREIGEPTVHADLAATLLEGLAGKPIEIAHSTGRSLLSTTELPDQVLICPYRWRDPYDLVLIKADERLQLQVSLNDPECQVFGFCDTFGNLDLETVHRTRPAEATAWVRAFRDELTRIVR